MKAKKKKQQRLEDCVACSNTGMMYACDDVDVPCQYCPRGDLLIQSWEEEENERNTSI